MKDISKPDVFAERDKLLRQHPNLRDEMRKVEETLAILRRQAEPARTDEHIFPKSTTERLLEKLARR